MSVRIKSREKLQGKSKASLWRNLSTDTLPNFFGTILCFVALSQFIFFFQKSRFAEIIRHLILIQTLISHMFAYSSRWRRKPWQDLYTSKRLLLKELYRSFLSIIAVIVIFLLGFHEFCCDADSVFPWCDVDNYRIPKRVYLTLGYLCDQTRPLLYVSLTIVNPFLLHAVH